jgi:hypothetical protein
MEYRYFEHESPDSKYLTSDEGYECYYPFVPKFVEENGYLPIECRECYKALIFWSYSRENESNFNRMLNTLKVSISGKYNESVVVFYFKEKNKMLGFLNILEGKMREFNVDGRIQWRVSGRYWQDAYPHFFLSTKELKPVQVGNEITMKEWLKQKGLSY